MKKLRGTGTLFSIKGLGAGEINLGTEVPGTVCIFIPAQFNVYMTRSLLFCSVTTDFKHYNLNA